MAEEPPAAGRSRLLDAVCLGGLFATWAWAFASTFLVPSLIGTHPLLLEVLNGGIAPTVAAGGFAREGRVSLLLAIVAPVLSWVPFDPFAWWTGRRFGRRVALRLLRGRTGSDRLVERTEAVVRRFGWLAVPLAPWLPVPTTLVFASAGWSGMPLWRFMALDAAGTLARSAAMVAIGWSVGGDAVSAARTVSSHAFLATVALAVALVAWVAWRARVVSRLMASPRGGGSERRPAGNTAGPPPTGAAGESDAERRQ